jgi:vacuolar iron transporter family protein
MTPEEFARNEYRDYVTYKELAKVETVPEFKKILEELTLHEESDLKFWLRFSSKKQFSISPLEIFFLKCLRKTLGLTFTAKFLERQEKQAVLNYSLFLGQAEERVKEQIRDIIRHEEYHERALIGHIKEERIAFTSSIILGLNDALIELTGALTGFAFAFRNNRSVTMAGLILGVAAALSMASSSYLSARHEEGKDPGKAGLYTGLSYLAVTSLLLSPFCAVPSMLGALAVMAGLVLLIVVGLSYYTAIVFERNFRKNLAEMFLCSVGVALVSFLIGLLARRLTGG